MKVQKQRPDLFKAFDANTIYFKFSLITVKYNGNDNCIDNIAK